MLRVEQRKKSCRQRNFIPFGACSTNHTKKRKGEERALFHLSREDLETVLEQCEQTLPVLSAITNSQ
jgi:hypothetical protein